MFSNESQAMRSAIEELDAENLARHLYHRCSQHSSDAGEETKTKKPQEARAI